MKRQITGKSKAKEVKAEAISNGETEWQRTKLRSNGWLCLRWQRGQQSHGGGKYKAHPLLQPLLGEKYIVM